MNPLIMIVEDNVDLLYVIKLSLEANKYRVLSAKNGKEALDLISQSTDLPEVIISDIMMPIVDGYDFFTEVSKNPKLNQIPFIFLTAKSSPEDIRFGKLLGVDDYLTKPFNEDDLLAVVSGKLARNQKRKNINEEIEVILSSFDIEPPISIEDQDKIFLLLMFWDDKYGPKLQAHYPIKNKLSFSFEDIGNQLFQATLFIYGHGKITNAEGILLNLENIKMSGYAYFNSYPAEHERFGQKQYMLAVIAPAINYFHSLKIKALFNKISKTINNKEKVDFKTLWKKVIEILTTNVLSLNP